MRLHSFPCVCRAIFSSQPVKRAPDAWISTPSWLTAVSATGRSSDAMWKLGGEEKQLNLSWVHYFDGNHWAWSLHISPVKWGIKSRWIFLSISRIILLFLWWTEPWLGWRPDCTQQQSNQLNPDGLLKYTDALVIDVIRAKWSTNANLWAGILWSPAIKRTSHSCLCWR